jgi:hypothetical protein
MVNLNLADWSRGGVTNGIRLQVTGIDERMTLLYDALKAKLQMPINGVDVFYRMDLEADILYILYMQNINYDISEPKDGLYVCEYYEIMKL